MAEQELIHRNTFEGGLNTDLSKSILNANQYVDAQNVTLVNSGNFLVLEDVKGTLELADINATTNTTTVLGAFPCRYQIQGTDGTYPGITIFTHEEDPVGTSNLFKITAYFNNTVYKLYEETVGDAYLVASDVASALGGTNERLMDAVVYPENNLDIMYFTDFYNRPRKLRCYIPSSYAGSAFLTEDDLDLFRKPALGTIVLDSTNGITTGGSLLTGSYQLAYQLYNEDSNKYSGFSLLTTPIQIYSTGTNTKSAGIGQPSNKKITVDITPTEDEAAYYTHYRVAVVENVGTADSINVGVTPLEALSLSGGIQQNVEIKSNQQYSFTTLDDVVIDLAAIQTVKTLTIKDNRLLLGNIINKNLTYDNGDPAVAGTSTIVIATHSTNSAESELFQSTKRGYFRDEVYRFAISYFDENGYFSPPKTLDLSAVDYNQISGAIDLKFPSRSYSSGGVFFTIMDADDDIQSLGLSLVDITNHPTWSKGFVILRAKRKKNILFQTPIIPMAKLSGIGAVGKYPTEYRVGSGLTTTTNTELEPMGPSTVFVPYNMYYGSPAQSPGLYAGATTGTGNNLCQTGEAQPLQYMTSAEFVMIFPPDTMYGSTPQSFSGSQEFKTVDAVVFETDWDQFDSTGYSAGTSINTSASASFFSTRDELHFFNHGHAKSVSTLRSSNVPFKNNLNIDNYANGDTLNGSNIDDFTKVMTQGITFGTAPNNQRSVIVDFNASIINAVSSPPTFAGISPATTPGYIPHATSTVGSYARTLYADGGFVANTSPDGLWEWQYVSLGNWDASVETGLSDTYLKDGVTTASQGDAYTVTAGGGTPYNFGGGRNVLIQNGDVIFHDGTRWRCPADSDFYKRIKSNPIEIANVIAGLDDARYGADDDYNEFIFTGAKHVFTNTQVSTNTRPAVDLEVWGGDCVVSPHTFKIADSTYVMTHNDKFHTSGTAEATLATRFEQVWLDSTDVAALNMPCFIKNAAQYITILLESEYNGAIVDHSDSDYMMTESFSGVKIIGAPTEAKARYSRPYLYNINLNRENDQRIFLPVDSLMDVTTKYKSRVYYSDLKVYQTDLEGFDVFRVDNIYDLPETYGALTKLVTSGDRLYALQRQGIAVLPVGERILETTDTSQLAVRSGEFLGTPVYIDTLRGCQHMGSVVDSGRAVYFLDALNKAVCSLDNGVQVLSGNGLSTGLRTALASTIIDRNVVGAYDITRDQYYIVHKGASNRFAYVWNQGLQKWESNIVFPERGFGAGLMFNGAFVIVGRDTIQNYTSIHQAHAGNYSQFMGTYSQPSVTFIANPSPDYIKVFDALLVNTNAPLSTLSAVVTSSQGQTAGTTAFDTKRGEGNYKVKILRDSLGSVDGEGAFTTRLRGQYATIQLLWGYDSAATRSTPVNISTVLTKFRPSANLF